MLGAMPTYQSVTAGDRIEVGPYLARARESLRAAELLRDAGLAADCVTRAHQACVHAERALLAVEKRSPPDWRSVHRMCTLHFLQNGEIPPERLPSVEGLMELRLAADDQPQATLGPDDAADGVAAARAFVEDAERWLAQHGYR
jgi:uncharacterized protein (UPF0332 family)